jgi:hypothetical protein
MWALVALAAPAAAPAACTVSNGTLNLERFSSVSGGKLLPGFLFMQGESDGLEQDVGVRTGGGRGTPIPFVPDDNVDDAIFEGTSPDLRSPQLPYLKYDTWGCERKPEALPVILMDTPKMRVTITPQFGGKVWSMHDKVAGREFFFDNPAHQPANIGARGAWVAGGLEFNWAPGFLGHSAFTEERVWAARLQTELGDVVRVYEFDRYNSTVYQVDLLLDGDELWTHVKVHNPNNDTVLGYWWTCAAHTASPGTRILAPASTVTVETYVGSPLRNAPWPNFDNGMLNSTFSGMGDERLVDSSFLGNIAYTGDYFLRVPQNSRRWIAHVDDSGDYVAVHGHPLNGTKFFTWGQSGPGRFMQDFLAGGEAGGGYYTELQSGVTPTQQQVFTLPGQSSIAFTEYFKPMRRPGAGPLPTGYANATAEVGRWWESSAGIPQSKVAKMETFFSALEDRPVKRSELLSEGSPWGALHEKLTGRPLAPGATFFSPRGGSATNGAKSNVAAADDADVWRELVETGTFSAATLSSVRAPRSYAVDAQWVAALETSASRHGSTWLHKLLLSVAYIEAGEVTRPRELLKAASQQPGGALSPIVARNLAVLESDAEAAWPLFELAWNLTRAVTLEQQDHEAEQRLAQNVADELIQFTIGNLAGATTAAADVSSVWFKRLQMIREAAQAVLGASGSDTILLAQVIIDANLGLYKKAMGTLAAECFPTLGRGRDVLIGLWKASAVGNAAAAKGRPLLPVEAHQARKAAPVPRNIGCPYATLYCEQYW